jgi:hypothetical protein
MMRRVSLLLCLLTAACTQGSDLDVAVSITRTSQNPVVAEPGADLEISFLIDAEQANQGSPTVSLSFTDEALVACTSIATSLVSDAADEPWTLLAGSFDCACQGTDEGTTDYVLTVTNAEGQPTATGSVSCATEVIEPRASLIASTPDSMLRVGAEGAFGTSAAEGAYDVLVALDDSVVVCGEDSAAEPVCAQSIDGGVNWFRAFPGVERIRRAVYIEFNLIYLATDTDVLESIACAPESILDVSPAAVLGAGFSSHHGCMATAVNAGTYTFYRSPDCTTEWTSEATALALSSFADQPGVVVAVEDTEPAVLTSTDGGDTWQPTAGLPLLVAPAQLVATPSGAFLAAFDDALYQSTDGETWTLHSTSWAGGTLEWSDTGGGWFSSGADGISFSSDAVTWTQVEAGNFLAIVGM